MKALRVENGELLLADVAQPSAPEEALVRVTLSGICNTDLEIARGYARFNGTVGHEFVGVVERSDDRPHLVGKRVVGEINAGCGVCDICQTGDERHCPTRTVLGIVGRDGAHAEFLQLPSRNLIEVPANVTDQQAVFVEPLAAAYGITEQVDIGVSTDVGSGVSSPHRVSSPHVSKGSSRPKHLQVTGIGPPLRGEASPPPKRLAVIGDGKLGLLCAMSLALHSDNVTIIGKHPSKIAIAEKSGAEGVLLSSVTPAMSSRFDIVVEASGSESGLATALDLVRPRGKIVLKSTFHGTPAWPAARVVVDEITIIGSRCGRFEPALRLLENRLVSVADLIEDVMPLSQGVGAMSRAAQNGVLKILLAA